MSLTAKAQLRELERRLDREPSNLGLRVQVAGLMHQTGRTPEAVELYRSVALVYRDQGRHRQAIAVCHSILDIAPQDAACREMLASMAIPDEPTPPPARGTPSLNRETPLPRQSDEPKRRSSIEPTPLPSPVPYHVADPTSGLQRTRASDTGAPVVEGEATRPGGTDKVQRSPLSGLAEAARQISGLIARADASGPAHDEDVASALETRKRPRITTEELAKIVAPPPTAPMEAVDIETAEHAIGTADSSLDPVLTPPPDGEDEPTSPVSLIPGRTRDTARTILDGPFFAALPPDARGKVLARFARKTVAAGTTIVRQGDRNHPLFVVVRGRLDQRVDNRLLAPISANEYVGETALLARAPAGAHVVAAVESELLVLAAKDFYELASAYPALWAELKATAERRARGRKR
jgi:hypothetical protein